MARELTWDFRCPKCGKTENLSFGVCQDDGLNMGHCLDRGFRGDGIEFEVEEQEKQKKEAKA